MAHMRILTALFVTGFLVVHSGCQGRPKKGSFNWAANVGKGVEFKIYMHKDHEVELVVKSEGKSDVDLFVYKHGKELYKDESMSSDCRITFVPDESTTHTVAVVNRQHVPGSSEAHRNGSNKGTLTFEQKERKK